MIRAVAAGALLVVVACTSSSPLPKGNETVVSPWHEVKVPGVKIFTTRPKVIPPDYDARGAYLQLDFDATKRSGKDAMKVVAARIQDPTQLAILSQLFLDSVGGQLVTTAAEAQEDRAAPLVAPPVVKDGILEYWHWVGGMARYIQRSRVNLTTFDREVKSGQEIERELTAPR